MDLLGYSNGLDIAPLLQVTISATPKELRALSAFFLQCADEIENDPKGWEHEHFPDNDSVVIFNSARV